MHKCEPSLRTLDCHTGAFTLRLSSHLNRPQIAQFRFWDKSLPEFDPEAEAKTHSVCVECPPPQRHVNQLHREPVTFSYYANWMLGNPHRCEPSLRAGYSL